MKRKLKFIWLDDNPDRVRPKKNMEETIGVEVVFIDVKGASLGDKLSELFKSSKPDLIIIDHVLDKIRMSDDGLIRYGSTVAEIVREKWLNCPIIGVTAAPRIEGVDLQKKSLYEALYPIEEFSMYYDSILSIAESFQTLTKRRPQSVSGLLKLLNPPKDDIVRLSAVIPDDLKSNYGNKSLSISISKWVRYILLEKPGFLYDSLWAATLLGIKEKGFDKVKKIFKKAKYDGIFADQSNEKWWQTRIREMLYKRFAAKNLQNTRILGRQLPGMDEKRDFSVCYACKGDEPEIVGYTDEKAEKRVQLHLRCSVLHPNFEKSLYFEEIRMMKGAE